MLTLDTLKSLARLGGCISILEEHAVYHLHDRVSGVALQPNPIHGAVL